jgi:hypothetical protein
MADEVEWLAIGLAIGLLVGIPIGWIIAQMFTKTTHASVVFDRDSEGRITGIHYVPGGGKAGST